MERFAAQAFGSARVSRTLAGADRSIKRFMTLRPVIEQVVNIISPGARHLFGRHIHGGNIASQHHHAGKAVKKNNLHRAGFGSNIASDNRRLARRDGKDANRGNRHASGRPAS